MRHPIGVAAFAAAAIFTSAVQAANGPNGKYAFVSVEMCEAKLTVTKDSNGKVTNVSLSKAGLMSGNAGYITFTPTSASGGKATISGAVLIEGGAVRIGTSGFNWIQKPDNLTGVPYSYTATTFTFGGQVYQFYGSNNFNTTYQNVYLIRRDTVDGNANCVQTMSATKQVQQ